MVETPLVTHWTFPRNRTHAGILLGNSRVGLSVWGEKNIIRITVGRSDCWDHRGGKPWVEGMSYARIRELLEAADEAGLRMLFEQEENQSGEPESPSLLPLGRWELVFGPEVEWTKGTLFLEEGRLLLSGKKNNLPIEGSLFLAMDRDIWVWGSEVEPGEIRAVPSWDLLGDQLAAWSFREPRRWNQEGEQGWVMERPVDPPVAFRADSRQNGQIYFCTAVDTTVEKARESAGELIGEVVADEGKALLGETKAWWKDFWSRTPRLQIPHPRLSFFYYYGMYKFGAMTVPGGVAAGLQGPWIEEFQMPPWSSDYHFNVNVQLCYLPAYRGNQARHLRPLFDLIASWLPKLRENARIFVGIDDGLMLPHAVDDRGTCMGGFWTGSIDHGCTAWVADMMYRYYAMTGDETFLREQAFPFLLGSFRVYEEMLERGADGQLSFPVSVSPEYRASEMNAWGRNASFQLACFHRLRENLIEAAGILGKDIPEHWEAYGREVPGASLYGRDTKKEIALWEGTPLEESHRHPSHLMGLYPFDTIDPADPEWAPVVRRSINTWVEKGMGLWSGWCIPLAAILHTRLGNGEMAELLLEIWGKVFVNEGEGTLHDYTFPGFTMIGAPPSGDGLEQLPERMQMDAGMGVTAALLEMFVHRIRDRFKLFGGIPRHWQDCSFAGIALEGGFLISGEKADGRLCQLSLQAEGDGGELLLEQPEALLSTGKPTVKGPEGCWQEEVLPGGLKAWKVRLKAGQSVQVEW